MNISFSKKFPAGMTLFELMVAVSLFTIVMVVATTLFLRSIDSQARAITSKDLQESLNFAMATMSTEAAGAIADPTSCSIGLACTDPTAFFCTTGSNTILLFRNKDGACVNYHTQLDSSGTKRLEVTRNGQTAFLTPANVKINKLNFQTGYVTDASFPVGEATLYIDAQSLTRESFPDSLKLQTTVSTWPGM